MLHNPVDGTTFLDPWNKSSSWNGKLAHTHGGGCRGDWHQQGNRSGGIMRRDLPEQSCPIISASPNVLAQNCSDLLA